MEAGSRHSLSTTRIKERTPMSDTIDLLINPRDRDLGGFSVRRVLPHGQRRTVGPFIFFDHMGPATFSPGEGIDVRPHPHIGLATVTFLFEGEIMHRDSLGSAQAIRPGDVNWMTAGRGIVHSERTGPETRAAGHTVHAIQSWVALPKEHEETEPAFHHHPKDTLPLIEQGGASLRLIAGTAYGKTSPVEVLHPTVYLGGELSAGASLDLPGEHEELAVYVVDGSATLDGEDIGTSQMAVLTPGAAPNLASKDGAHVMILGGSAIDGPRQVWWNFVASNDALMERGKREWKEGLFAKVPDDEEEFIPLPES